MTEDYQTQFNELLNPHDGYNSLFSNDQRTDWTTDAWHTFGLELDIKQLAELNTNDEDSARFLFAHEAAHTVLQNAVIFENNAWREELACDFMAGVQSELNGFDIENAIDNFEHIQADADCPTAELRGDFAQYGKAVAQEFKNDGTDFTLQNLMERFLEHSDAEAQTNDAISFTGKYTDAEINKMRENVSKYEYEVSNLKQKVHHWENCYGLSHSSGDLSKLNSAKSELNNALSNLKDAKSKLSYAT